MFLPANLETRSGTHAHASGKSVLIFCSPYISVLLIFGLRCLLGYPFRMVCRLGREMSGILQLDELFAMSQHEPLRRDYENTVLPFREGA